MYLIYKHTSKTTGKSYIGKTIYVNNPNRRWKNGLGYSKESQPAFYAAIQKYGWDDFEHTVLENYISSAEEACEREQFWIAYYHTWVYDQDSNGYNITKGGEGAVGHTVSECTKQRLREARLNQTNLSLANNKGKKFYNNGKVCIMCLPENVPEGFIPGRLLSDEQRAKISQNMSKNNANRKGKLQKITIVKDGVIKCIGATNLNKYAQDGWEPYVNGSGGHI